MKQYKLTIFDDQGNDVRYFKVDQPVLDLLLMFADSRAMPNLERYYILNEIQFVYEEFDNGIKTVGEA